MLHEQETLDVLVIGAGQAGLAMGGQLQKLGKSFVILGKEEQVGDVWRKRYDSLVLFTPRWYSSLPGLPLMGDPNGYASKDEIAAYLESYALHFGLPVLLGTEVLALDKIDGLFRAFTNRGMFYAKQVVVCTGPFHRPYVPPAAHGLSDGVTQLHSSEYRNASQLRPGSVLVAGAGNSGAQIAVELSSERDVYLSSGHSLKFMPLQLFGKSIFWWFGKTGLLRAGADSPVGRVVRKRNDPIFGLELRDKIRQGQVRLRPRVVDIREDRILFENDADPLTVSNVIWATGFRSDYGWIQIPGASSGAGPEGLFFLGMPWQRNRGSALIGGVGEDSAVLAKRMFG
ncbi:flavin-containing monooxygenase [Cohnella candidum]|uniref:Oxidoreductase n=1 Tax=Cohnella candidum TaxID=2674991 RepID=A0A3G3JYR6_9BACL|nr:NAD(P)/FAD-dependent oxidoreductase [Cohnella candidum]AYQ73385.1 oxidoreductase [Cohnella candidum]